MKIEDFDYILPKSLIAQEPVSPRDHSRMMVLDKKTGVISHRYFFDLPHILNNNYVLVFNDTRVIPARVLVKKQTGGKIEILFLREIKPGIWESLIGGKASIGLKIKLDENLEIDIISREKEVVFMKVNSRNKLFKFLEKHGQMPLPPYIKKKMRESEARKKYQTIFACINGSVVAPTASLHFTRRVLNKLKKEKIESVFLTLEVGWGTFAPVKTKKIEDHKIHNEKMVVTQKTADFLNQKKKEGKKILAVGTTVARALETVADENGILHEYNKETSIYIYPPYKFKFVDAMLTNFHLPKSSLLFLVSAFAGRKKILDAYKNAIKNKYRFFSFGDCMLIG